MLHRRAFLLSASLTAMFALAGPVHAELKPSLGPNGETATPAKSLTLTPEKQSQGQSGQFQRRHRLARILGLVEGGHSGRQR